MARQPGNANVVRNRLSRGRRKDGRGRGATRARPAERRCRAARRHVGLQARNALIGRIGLFRLLAQNHAVIRTAEHTRCALEAERGALRERELGRGGQRRCDNARYGHTRWHRLRRSNLPARARVACNERARLSVPAGSAVSKG